MTPGRHAGGARTPRFALLVAAAALAGAGGCVSPKPELKLPGPNLRLPKPSNIDTTPRDVPPRPADAPTSANVRRPSPPDAGVPATGAGLSINSSRSLDGTVNATALTPQSTPLRNAAQMSPVPVNAVYTSTPTARPGAPVTPPTGGDTPPIVGVSASRDVGTNTGGIVAPVMTPAAAPPADPLPGPPVVPVGMPYPSLPAGR